MDSASSGGASASIQSRSPCSVRMTGMRSWIVATSSFGAVVMMAHVGSSPFQVQMPAKANSAPDMHRLLRLLAGDELPLVEAVSGDEAAPLANGRLEHRPLQQRLAPRLIGGGRLP